ncbi:NAD-dependent epimerase/dehydratase family protein [Paraburkholderia saeva]|uniref:NAD-dependent epimerase/dehydratase family protein n=1 Tax=Paraburkholderia saeva TaxID=2777537 RepID=UPI001E515C16|nr:NAD-dependent epimerase/dehydratase family protein [Paraburkholderia saeva]
MLLTGGAGFIGANLARILVGSGYEVVTLGRRRCTVEGVVNVEASRLDATAFQHAMSDHRFELVFHLAAAGVHPADRDRDELIRVNAILPAEMVAAASANGVGAVVSMGSSAEYAAQAVAMLSEDMALETQKVYGASKAAGSLLALATAADVRLPFAVLRAFNVYGPGEAEHRLLPSLASKLARDEAVKLSAGTQVRDFLYVDDACRGLIASALALRDGRMNGGAYNLSTGVGTSVGDFARTVARHMGADESLLHFGALPLRPDDLPVVVGDPSRVQRETGWRTSYSLDQGVDAALSRLTLN